MLAPDGSKLFSGEWRKGEIVLTDSETINPEATAALRSSSISRMLGMQGQSAKDWTIDDINSIIFSKNISCYSDSKTGVISEGEQTTPIKLAAL